MSNFRQNANAHLLALSSSPQTLDDQLTGDRSQYGYNDDSSPGPQGGEQTSLSNTASGLPIAKITQGIQLYKAIVTMPDKNLARSLGLGKPINDDNREAFQSELLARKLVPTMKVDAAALWSDVGDAIRRTGAQSLTGTGEMARVSGVMQLSNPNHDEHGRFAAAEGATADAKTATKKWHETGDDKDRQAAVSAHFAAAKAWLKHGSEGEAQAHNHNTQAAKLYRNGKASAAAVHSGFLAKHAKRLGISSQQVAANLRKHGTASGRKGMSLSEDDSQDMEDEDNADDSDCDCGPDDMCEKCADNSDIEDNDDSDME